MEEKVFARGFKGFDHEMKCRGKQYAENTVFEENGGDICNAGVMHFCEYPLDVLDYYPPVNNCEISTFAPVEALAECQKKEDKSATTKIRIGAKIDLPGLAKAAVDFVMERVQKEKAATNTGDQSAATNTGDQSAASVSGKESFAITTGIDGKVKGAFGCYIMHNGCGSPVYEAAVAPVIGGDSHTTIFDGFYFESVGRCIGTGVTSYTSSTPAGSFFVPDVEVGGKSEKDLIRRRLKCANAPTRSATDTQSPFSLGRRLIASPGSNHSISSTL